MKNERTHETKSLEAEAKTPAWTITSAANPDETDDSRAKIVVMKTTTDPRPRKARINAEISGVPKPLTIISPS